MFRRNFRNQIISDVQYTIPRGLHGVVVVFLFKVIVSFSLKTNSLGTFVPVLYNFSRCILFLARFKSTFLYIFAITSVICYFYLFLYLIYTMMNLVYLIPDDKSTNVGKDLKSKKKKKTIFSFKIYSCAFNRSDLDRIT